MFELETKVDGEKKFPSAFAKMTTTSAARENSGMVYGFANLPVTARFGKAWKNFQPSKDEELPNVIFPAFGISAAQRINPSEDVAGPEMTVKLVESVELTGNELFTFASITAKKAC